VDSVFSREREMPCLLDWSNKTKGAQRVPNP